MTIENQGYPRQCPRCGAQLHVPDPPHMCKDLRERMQRQEAAIAKIRSLLVQEFGSERARAEAIYRALAGKDLP